MSISTRIYLVTKIAKCIDSASRYSGDTGDFALGRTGMKKAKTALFTERASNRVMFRREDWGESWLELRDNTGVYKLDEKDEKNLIAITATAATLNAERQSVAEYEISSQNHNHAKAS